MESESMRTELLELRGQWEKAPVAAHIFGGRVVSGLFKALNQAADSLDNLEQRIEGLERGR